MVNFYQAIAEGDITAEIVRDFLNREGEKLPEKGEAHYYLIRDRFNRDHQPLDFLFLNRAGFNGMIRFNRKGEFNIPLCRKPQRFAQAYITKIVNQVSYVSRLFKAKDFTFKRQNFKETIYEAGAGSIIYCDPPYIDRYVDYYSGWDGEQEKELYQALSTASSKFILSTWHHNDFRKNEYIDSLWNRYNILTREHFYHVGAKEENRNPMVEAIVTNYDASNYDYPDARNREQLMLLAKKPDYST